MKIVFERESGVYLIRNVLANKVYVGSSANIERRHREHFARLRRREHESVLLQRAFDEFGEAAFTFSVLALASGRAALIAAEQRYMDSFRSADPDYGYNGRPKADSNSGKVFSAETRQKIRAANLGKKQSAETIEKRFANRRGVPISEEHKACVSRANKGRVRSDVKKWAPARFAMFKPQQVAEMRNDRNLGLTYRRLAEKYGCSVGTAHFVVNGTGAFYSECA